MLNIFIFNFFLITEYIFLFYFFLPPPLTKTHLFLCTWACFGLMHSGIIHADGSREIRYSKSMTLLLYTLEYALVLLSSFRQSRYQSENDQGFWGHLKNRHLPSFFPSFHIITFTAFQVYLLRYFKDISTSTPILQGYKYSYYYTISLLFPIAYDPLLATKKHSVAYSSSDSPGALRTFNGRLFAFCRLSFIHSFIFFFVSIL